VLELRSTAFAPYGPIGVRYATRGIPGGENVSIPYQWAGTPAGTRSFALTLVDRAEVAHDWVHWLVIDIPPGSMSLPEGASGTARMPEGARELANTFGFEGYGGPQAPLGTGEHPYEATVYALDVPHLDLDTAITLVGFLAALDGHVLGRSTYSGRFAHP